MIERIYIQLKKLGILSKWILCRLIYKDHSYFITDRHSNGHTKICTFCGNKEKIYYDDGFKYHN